MWKSNHSAVVSRSRLVIGALFIVFLSAAGIPNVSAEVSLGSVLADTHARFEWDTALGFGVIVARNEQFAFVPGNSWGLLNSSRRIRTGSITQAKNGEILFTDQGAKVVVAALSVRRDPAPSRAARAASAEKPRIAAIIIDPGHGGKDPGTIQPSNEVPSGTKPLEEKNVVLQVGLDVYHALQAKYPDKQIVITRKRDVYVNLEGRTQIANSITLKPNEAKIFVSIHANASFDHNARGYEVWYLPPNYKRNVVNPKMIGTDSKALLPILNNMREQEYETESILLGKDILGGIHGSIGSDEVDRGLKSNDWFVVRNSKMPAVLIELGFVSNPQEAKLLENKDYLRKLSAGIVTGISKFVTFFDSKSGFQE